MVTHVTRKHIRESKSGFACFWEGCRMKDHVFRVKQNLVKHLRMHTGERPYKCPVEGCGKTFPHRANVYQHKRSHLLTRIKCTYPGCKMIFSRKQNLDAHYRVVHLEDDSHKCTVPGCGKLFTNMVGLRSHIERHASSKKLYYCKFAACKGIQFPSKYALDQHRFKHVKKNIHKCDYEGCGKMYPTTKTLQKHLYTHSSKIPPELQSTASPPIIAQTSAIQPPIVKPVNPQTTITQPVIPQATNMKSGIPETPNLPPFILQAVPPVTPQTSFVPPVTQQTSFVPPVIPQLPNVPPNRLPTPFLQQAIPQNHTQLPGIPPSPIMQPTIVNAPNGRRYMLLLPANMNFMLKPT